MIVVVWFCPLLTARTFRMYDPVGVEFVVIMVSVEVNDGFDD